MLTTKHGPFNGKSWEDLCQQVFKIKYEAEGYHSIPANPGDFGLEGFTLITGIGFQCYCPEKNYGSKELYEAQRDKITRDIAKLKKNQKAIAKRIGDKKLSKWYFVTPEVQSNDLLEHARNKELEVRSWNLPILADDFQVHIRDADYYLQEINQVRTSVGNALSFDATPPALAPLVGPAGEYEGNILRKSGLRLEPKKHSPNIDQLINSLSQQTLMNFLEGQGFLKQIEQDAPTVYFRLVRLINEYEHQVKEESTTWVNTADDLTLRVREGLTQRILSELQPNINDTTASRISRYIVARWLAVCELDFTD